MRIFNFLKNRQRPKEKRSLDLGDELLILIKNLENDCDVSDEEVLKAFFSFQNSMQTNCDSAAQGLFSCVSVLCYYKPHLSKVLLAEPLRALYYLGIESLEDIKKYIKWFITFEEPYIGRATAEGYDWLQELMNDKDEIIIEAFKQMYDAEDNEWRESQPSILQS